LFAELFRVAKRQEHEQAKEGLNRNETADLHYGALR
jgi:hypothetical protein